MQTNALYYGDNLDILRRYVPDESVEEHLSMKRLLTDLLDTDGDDEQFLERIAALKDQVEHHVQEEENELFPRVQRFLDATALEALGQNMTALQVDLEEQGEPRSELINQIDQPARL